MSPGCCDERPTGMDPERPSSCCGDGVASPPAPTSTPCCGEGSLGRPAREAAPCCGPEARSDLSYHEVPVVGRRTTLAGDVAEVSTRWRLRDWVGRLLVRLGFHRMSYAVAPGLYAVGRPGPDAPVLVSANYKLSFDLLRRAVAGLDAWILVLDTRGVNVWCAAGKGTFGTAEIARRVEAARLAQVVRHRRLIVPQLGAPSVAAHEVERRTGFGVVFGPVRAADIAEFMACQLRPTPRMRRVSFGLGDRVEVALVDFVTAARAAALLSALLLVLTAWNGRAFSLASAWSVSAPAHLALWSGVAAGTVLFAALLPWLPGRLFAVKGAVLGTLVAAVVGVTARGLLPLDHPSLVLALTLVSVALASYLGANFTGSSTFTSLSGVKRELRLAVPVLAATLVVAAVVPLAHLLVEGVLR